MTFREPEQAQDGPPLLSIALARLPEMQTASGLFRETARIDGIEDGGPVTPLLASIVVLLGLTRIEVAELEQPFPIGALRTRILRDLALPGITAGELGLALWAETRMGGSALAEIERHLEAGFSREPGPGPVEQLAWVVSGLVEARQFDPAVPDESLARATDELTQRQVAASGLFRDVPHRRRGSAVPIGGQLHALHALSQLLRTGEGEELRATAQQLADRLVALQRPDGGWPGLIDPLRGEPVAWYPALTVTQVALAPLAFRAAGEAGLTGDFTHVIRAGMGWARGGNPLGFELVHPAEGRLDRGIMPRRKPGAVGRGVNLVERRIRGRLAEPDRNSLILDPAVSSDDLGWVLEAWAGR